MVKKTDRKMERNRRHLRVRRKISGTAERPLDRVLKQYKFICSNYR